MLKRASLQDQRVLSSLTLAKNSCTLSTELGRAAGTPEKGPAV